MERDVLPKAPAEVLHVPDKDMPDVIRGLLSARELSPLMRHIHRDLRSPNPDLRVQARAALDRLGFVE